MKHLACIVYLSLASLSSYAQSNKPMAQYPSPMQEDIRAHERIPREQYRGYSFRINHLLPRPVNVYIPLKTGRAKAADLLIHFYGSKNVVAYAAEHYHGRLIAVTVNLGAGSSVYARPFSDSTLFGKLLDSVQAVVTGNLHHAIRIRHVIVSGFSAGYGAVRAVLRTSQNRSRVDEVLLLDGLHAGYIPDRKVLAEGGKIDSSEYIGFLQFCRLAILKNSTKKFLFTHSEIFPGTFVSTTESAGYLLHVLGVKAVPVLKWGPLGMQQISVARKNHFEIMGFAGNSAPDHIDHLEGLYYFLNRLKKL